MTGVIKHVAVALLCVHVLALPAAMAETDVADSSAQEITQDDDEYLQQEGLMRDEDEPRQEDATAPACGVVKRGEHVVASWGACKAPQGP